MRTSLYDGGSRSSSFKEIIALEISNVYDSPVVTTIEPLTQFYQAEDYHQEYYQNNKNQPYCKMVIQPKIEKFEKLFKSRLKKE